MDVMQAIEREHVAELTADKEIPDFGPGDTIRVGVRVVEGEKVRVQAFEGVCIARKGRGLNANFTVRKISFGEGVERVFPLYAPVVDSITVVRRGRVRRAKLYYLRGRTGRAARIRELTTGRPSKTAPVEEAPAPVEPPAPEVTEAASPVPVAEPDAPEAPEAPEEARGPETEAPAAATADEEVAVVPEGDGEEISAPTKPEATEEDGAAGSPSGIKKLFGRFGRGKK